MGDVTLRTGWQAFRDWLPAIVMLAVGLWFAIGGSTFGFNPANVIGGLVLAVGGAVVALVAHNTVSTNPSQLRPTILAALLIATLLSIVIGQQTQCISGAGRESEDLDRATARGHTENALVFLLGLSAVTTAGAIAGYRDAVR